MRDGDRGVIRFEKRVDPMCVSTPSDAPDRADQEEGTVSMPERAQPERYRPRYRVPLTEARELWRRRDLYIHEREEHTIADPITGDPVKVEFVRSFQAILTPELLGWSLEELEGIEDEPEPLPPPRSDIRRVRPPRGRGGKRR